MNERAPLPPGALVFLYNHDAGHQVSHTIGILRELARSHASFPLVCATGSATIRARVQELLGDAAQNILFVDLSLPGWLGGPLRVANRIIPAERLARLRWNADRLRSARLIVSPERTCLYLKRRWDGAGPKFLFVPHGAGDRSVSYHPALGQFDYMLVSGQKVADEMIAQGLSSPGRVACIGYAKFDLIDLSARPDFFGKGRPTFVYNPHFDPWLSSWYDHGHAIVNWFARGDGQRFNLILAPHVMLFRKELHISPEYRVARRRPDIDPAWRDCANILIDVDSEKLFDMSYMLGSDAYIGDFSSQVYEFIARPRPVFLVSGREGERADDARYPFWDAGQRVPDAASLFPLLNRYDPADPAYHERQKQLFEYTFSVTDTAPSRRGAEWLTAYMTSSRAD